jgi:hypothetical protein
VDALDRAHRLAVAAPRPAVSRGLALELAKLAVEVMRLSGGAEFIQGSWIKQDDEVREQHWQALKQELEQMRIGHVWMTEQRDAWERKANEFHSEINRLNAIPRCLRWVSRIKKYLVL